MGISRRWYPVVFLTEKLKMLKRSLLMKECQFSQ